MPPAGCITKQQLLSFNWGPNCSSSNREQRVQFNKGENSSGSNPIIFFLLSLVHSFILFLLPWSRIQISESIYLLRARVVSIHTITLIEFLPFIYRSCKSRCQQKQFLQAEHLFIFIVEEENWDTCFGFSFCKPPPIFFRVYNYIHILLIDWWHLTKKVFVRCLLTYIKTFSPVKLKRVFVFENWLFIEMACMYRCQIYRLGRKTLHSKIYYTRWYKWFRTT